MKKSLLIVFVVGLIAVPTLSMAGESAGQYILLASNQLSEKELGMTTGQGFEVTPTEVKNQDGRIVIWDEWARSASGGTGAKAPSPGQVSINYAAGQVAMTGSR